MLYAENVRGFELMRSHLLACLRVCVSGGKTILLSTACGGARVCLCWFVLEWLLVFSRLLRVILVLVLFSVKGIFRHHFFTAGF